MTSRPIRGAVMSPAVDEFLTRARIAVFAIFICFGTILATWAVHLPTLQEQTGISTAQLGTVLLTLGLGSLVSMQFSGPLVDRVGSGKVAVIGTSAMALLILLPLAATSYWQAIAGALIVGVSIGAAEVSMNAAAVDLERRYGRPIMAAFHGTFSVGNVIGSAVAAVVYATGISVWAATAALSVVCAAAVLGIGATLLRQGPPVPDTESPGASSDAPDTAGRAERLPFGRLLMLGMVAFLLFLCEGSAMDWSSLHAQQHLGTGSAMGALAFGAFVAAMTLARFCADRVASKVGPTKVVRWGSAVATVGFVVIYLSPVFPLTVVGWLLVGLGLAGGVPQVLTAAGNVSGASGRALSRVVGLGYVALLAGPALVGFIAEVTSLNTAFLLPAGAALVCVFASVVVQPKARRDNRSGR